MSADWNEKARADLRKQISEAVVGHLRLGKDAPDEILEAHVGDLIAEACPVRERGDFARFASDELRRTIAGFREEQARWQLVTDCDRLDRAETALRDRGILLWQVSPCCDTCSGAELPDRIDVIEGRCPGFRQRVRGYGFFIEQNLPERLAESSQLDLYLAYGWFSPDGNGGVVPQDYEKHALVVANEICECLRIEGLEVSWNGDLAKKIGVPVNWQRRTRLT